MRDKNTLKKLHALEILCHALETCVMHWRFFKRNTTSLHALTHRYFVHMENDTVYKTCTITPASDSVVAMHSLEACEGCKFAKQKIQIHYEKDNSIANKKIFYSS